MTSQCDMCLKKFSVKRSLMRHIDSKHKKLRVFCSICKKPFSRSDSLAHHIATMHPTRTELKLKPKKPATEQAVVRLKRQRNRLPPSEIPPSPASMEASPQPKASDESGKNSQEPPVFPAPFVEIFSEDSTEVQIKAEITDNPCVMVNGGGESPTTSKTEQYRESGYTPTQVPDKPKRFNVTDELDYTVLDLMQQTAIDSKDEDRMFLLSILSDFKRVPLEKKLKVKARIVGAIVDALD